MGSVRTRGQHRPFSKGGTPPPVWGHRLPPLAFDSQDAFGCPWKVPEAFHTAEYALVSELPRCYHLLGLPLFPWLFHLTLLGLPFLLYLTSKRQPCPLFEPSLSEVIHLQDLKFLLCMPSRCVLCFSSWHTTKLMTRVPLLHASLPSKW